MRALILLLAMRAALALDCSPCECDHTDELNVRVVCKLQHANVTLDGHINESVKVKCEGTNFTCADLPTLSFGSNQTLPYLRVTSCPSHILRCVEQLQATGVSTVSLIDVSGTLTDDVAKLVPLEDSTIRDGPETRIPVAALSKLTNLRILSIHYTPVRLYSEEFVGFPPITSLELWYAKTPEIPENAFNGLSQLTKLHIAGNNISDIGVNSFRGLCSLEMLTLDNNDISSLSPGCFSHTPRLGSVLGLINALQELPAGVFYNLTLLEYIEFRSNAVEFKLQPKSLSQLPSLKHLVLKYMKIKALPDDLLTGNTALEKLSFNHNDIAILPVKIFKDLTSLIYLHLSDNKLEKVESGLFSQLKQLRSLNLNSNSLQILPDDLFSGLMNLETVTIEQNFLHTISPSAFQGASIHTLSLARNQLTFEAYDSKKNSPFSVLPELKKLLLSENKISTIFFDWLAVLNQLEELDLSYNNFKNINQNDLEFLSHNHNRIKVDLRHNYISSINMSLSKIVDVDYTILRPPELFSSSDITLDLRHNHITSITLYYPDQSPQDQSLGNLSSNPSNIIVLIENNPLNCDCGLYTLLMRLKGTKSLVSEPTFVIGNVECESPERLKRRLLKTVSPNDLYCDLPKEDCPDRCSCEIKPATNYLDLECDNLPQSLPVPEKFGAKYLSLKLLESPKSLNNLNIDLLNLTGIGLKDIPFAPSENVTQIDFSNNSLTNVPIDFLYANTTLYLSKNPFECDCWHFNEISILKNSSSVNDSEHLTCDDGRNLNKLDVSTLCSAYYASMIATGTCIVLLIIATILSVAIHRNKHEVFMYLSRIFPCIFTDDLTDSDKEYDIFISYAHKDLEYFRILLPRLENDFKQKTCLHYRDWSIGDLIPEQINRSVLQSRRTIILLSKNFLESTYANMEFVAAHNCALQEGRTRVILILLEDVTDNECLSEELKTYIKTNTYLSWDDPRFWERLQKALPRKNAKKLIWPEIFRRRVNEGVDVPLDNLSEN